jgi:DNA-binding transcriptional MerR regulator/methylmalonyl-CoA mutase cobalamin-binding subunit
MAVSKQMPTFNLKAVLQETGLKPDTLRAWERRYGLPQPERSAGGHRLYTQRDIEIVKWLIARQQEGLSISRAVDLWNSLESDGQDPLHMVEFAAGEAAVPAVVLPEGDALAELRQVWKSACLGYDERKAEQALSQAFAVYPVEVVCLELLRKGLAELGEGWYRGEVTVQQEHFASELAMRRLEALLAATPPPTRPERILVGCSPQEEHTFSPLLLTLFLRRRGWDVVYLGANVPVARLESAIDTVRPQLVILSVQQLHTAAGLLEMAWLLQERHIPLAFGGLVFNLLPALRNRIPGFFLGERLDLVAQAVDQILSSPPPLPPTQPVSEAYQKALAHYRERQALIESQMWQSLESMGITYEHFSNANARLSLNIAAGLALGDMDFLGVDIDWVEGLLTSYGLPNELMRRYMCTYYQAAKTNLDERGAPIVEWLERVTEYHPGD